MLNHVFFGIEAVRVDLQPNGNLELKPFTKLFLRSSLYPDSCLFSLAEFIGVGIYITFSVFNRCVFDFCVLSRTGLAQVCELARGCFTSAV